MKKIVVLIALLLLGSMLVSCIDGIIPGLSSGTPSNPPQNPGGADPAPDTEKPDEKAEPIIKGDSAVIFSADTAFTLVYPAGDTQVAGSVATALKEKIAGLGFKTPAVFSDADKSLTKCELLIGETDRNLSSRAKSKIESKIEDDPDGSHWVWYYQTGRLALYANSAKAYGLAIEELVSKYLTDGEILMKTDAKDVGYLAGPHEAYMEYTIPSNFYKGYTDPFGVSESDYKEMILTRVSEDTLVIEYDIGTASYSVNFVQKAWGLWMLGAMSFTENGKTHTMTSNGTDYEFVFTCNNEGDSTFRSGNHGNYPGDPQPYIEDDSSQSNDRLVDMTFYDAKTGEKISLPRVGSKARADGLRLVMHHNVYEKNYAKENVLMNVEKSYLFNGFEVLMDAKIYLTKDVHFNSSYSCMFPIMKDYGNCMYLYGEDGSKVYAKTNPTGDGSGKSYTVWDNKATKVELWGEKNPEYHLTVEVHNPEGQMFGCKTGKSDVGICDMLGGSGNKIYFAFGTAGITLDYGTELHFVNSWSFEKVEGFTMPTEAPDLLVVKP